MQTSGILKTSISSALAVYVFQSVMILLVFVECLHEFRNSNDKIQFHERFKTNFGVFHEELMVVFSAAEPFFSFGAVF